MNKYAYLGTTPIALKGVGLVMPGQVIEVPYALNNKLFERVEEPIASKKKRK